MEDRSSEQIPTTITFYSYVRLSPVIYRDARNWMLKLWANSNDNNFILGCLIETRSISRRTKFNVEAQSKFKCSLLFTRRSDSGPSHIETLKIECWSSEKIQTRITFYSDVGLRHGIYRDARNWILKLWANSNDNNFLLGCQIESHNI